MLSVGILIKTGSDLFVHGIPLGIKKIVELHLS